MSKICRHCGVAILPDGDPDGEGNTWIHNGGACLYRCDGKVWQSWSHTLADKATVAQPLTKYDLIKRYIKLL